MTNSECTSKCIFKHLHKSEVLVLKLLSEVSSGHSLAMMLLSPLLGQRLRLPLAVAACSLQGESSIYMRSMCLDIV